MTTPAYVTNENLFFEGGVLVPSVVILGTTPKVAVRWDSLDSVGQSHIAVLAAANGLFHQLTGFASVQSAVPGNAGVAATPGYDLAMFFPTITAATLTSLANNATVYTATITVDAVNKFITVVGSAAQTFTTLLGEINTDLGASAVATLSGGNIKVTSATTGVASTVSMVDTGVNLLFHSLTNFNVINFGVSGTAAVGAVAGYQIVTYSPAVVGANPSGLANDATIYKTSIVVDGVPKPVSATGSTNQTFTAVLATINTALGASGVATIVGGNIKVTSATTGVLSLVAIDDSTMPLTSQNVAFNTKLDNGLSWWDTYSLQTKNLYTAPLSLADKFALFGPTTDATKVYWDGTNFRYIINNAVV